MALRFLRVVGCGVISSMMICSVVFATTVPEITINGEVVSEKVITVVDDAAKFAYDIAKDDNHGYNNNGDGWGPVDYNCIGLVMEAYNQSGLEVGWCSIANMPANLMQAGFIDVTGAVDLNTGEGAVKGDVFWKINKDGKHGHTELFIGDGMLAGARSNCGHAAYGDPSGNEIVVSNYTNYGWQRVYRPPYTPVDLHAPGYTDGISTYDVATGIKIDTVVETEADWVDYSKNSDVYGETESEKDSAGQSDEEKSD